MNPEYEEKRQHLISEHNTGLGLKKLCEKGYFCNENGTVTSLISEKEMVAQESCRFVENTFGGSLPAFLAAFTSERQLSDLVL